MRILNTYFEKVMNPLGTIMIIGLFIAMICSVVAAIEMSDTRHKILPDLCFILALILLATNLFVVNNVIPWTYDEIPHYEIIVSESYPASQLLKNYDVTEMRGEILDCVDKDIKE